MRSVMKRKLMVLAILLVFVMTFAVQNAAEVEIRLLVWEFAFPRSLLIFLMLLIGMIAGWTMRTVFRITRNQ